MHEYGAAPDENTEVEKAWLNSHNMRTQGTQRWHAAE